MKYLKKFNESTIDPDIEKFVGDISLDLLDKGLNVDISWTPWADPLRKECDIIIWKHNGDEWHIPFEFDQDCKDFTIRINDYMMLNGLKLITSTVVQSGSVPNRSFTDIERAIKFLISIPTVEEIYFSFSNVEYSNRSNKI